MALALGILVKMADPDDYESLGSNVPLRITVAAGALAGIAEHCVMYPIDSVKVGINMDAWKRLKRDRRADVASMKDPSLKCRLADRTVRTFQAQGRAGAIQTLVASLLSPFSVGISCDDAMAAD